MTSPCSDWGITPNPEVLKDEIISTSLHPSSLKHWKPSKIKQAPDFGPSILQGCKRVDNGLYGSHKPHAAKVVNVDIGVMKCGNGGKKCCLGNN